jgi:1,2-diacylglycerol 3-alpha-glucosyltransferase
LRKARRRGGAITIANHVHILDSAMAGLASYPKKPIFTTIPENFRLPLAGLLVNSLGSVPIPQTPTENRIFFYEMSKFLRRGRFIHFFPEGELVKGDTVIRPFKRGAFQLAVNAQVPIIPMGISIRKSKWLLGRAFGLRRITVNVGEPLRPDSGLVERDAVNGLHDKAFAAMQELIRA